MHIHPLITDSESLKSLCNRLAKSPFVAVDTEFMRENTFWPELCLIQIGDVDEAAAVDPKADGLDMKPLLDLLVNNEDVLKVFHAGSQDIEIIYNITGKTPHPLFETQIAGMALGLGEQVGYSNLVESLVGKSLDKGARFTDWARRPLDRRQIDYAIGDVTHLAALFPKMLERLRRIMKDETIADVAAHPPMSQDALARVRGLSPAWAGNEIGARLMAALANSAPMPADEL